jgi:hypothetical protein
MITRPLAVCGSDATRIRFGWGSLIYKTTLSPYRTPHVFCILCIRPSSNPISLRHTYYHIPLLPGAREARVVTLILEVLIIPEERLVENLKGQKLWRTLHLQGSTFSHFGNHVLFRFDLGLPTIQNAGR